MFSPFRLITATAFNSSQPSSHPFSLLSSVQNSLAKITVAKPCAFSPVSKILHPVFFVRTAYRWRSAVLKRIPVVRAGYSARVCRNAVRTVLARRPVELSRGKADEQNYHHHTLQERYPPPKQVKKLKIEKSSKHHADSNWCRRET